MGIYLFVEIEVNFAVGCSLLLNIFQQCSQPYILHAWLNLLSEYSCQMSLRAAEEVPSYISLSHILVYK